MRDYDFIQDGIPHVIVSNCYYQEKTIAKDVPALTPIKLPRKGTYTDGELIVCLNEKSLQHLIDYNYDTKDPHDSIWLTFDLYRGDVITFRKPPDAEDDEE